MHVATLCRRLRCNHVSLAETDPTKATLHALTLHSQSAVHFSSAFILYISRISSVHRCSIIADIPGQSQSIQTSSPEDIDLFQV